ncbi:MAG: methyltransferase domain-containing protein [Pseudomonadota bacterium]
MSAARTPKQGSYEARTLSEAKALEAELLRRCEALAPELARPAHARDAASIKELWSQIDALRPELTDTLKRMRQRGGLPKERRKGGSSAELRAFKAERKAIQERLQIWSSVSDMVARHYLAEPQPLIPEHVPAYGDPLMEFLAATLHHVANPVEQSAEGFDHGAYADIAMPPLRFEALILAAYRLALARGEPRQMRFGDVGCGGGVKLVMARRFFGHCTGIEYESQYVANAEVFLKKVGLPNLDVEHADALTYEEYGKFDVLYFYRPMRSDQDLERLEQQVVANVKPGTLILAPYNLHLQPRAAATFTLVPSTLATCPELVPPIYAVGVSQEEADLWRRDAELTDTVPVPKADTLELKPGFWRPLLDASRYAFNS